MAGGNMRGMVFMVFRGIALPIERRRGMPTFPLAGGGGSTVPSSSADGWQHQY